MQTSFRAYAVAIAVLAAALLLRWALDPFLGYNVPLVTVFGAVACAVWLGGLWPAIAVAVAGYAACAYLFIAPRGQLGLGHVDNLIGFGAYLLTCGFIITIGMMMHRARARQAHDSALLLEAEKEKSRDLHSARFLAAIVESSDDAIISKSLGGVIQSWNVAAEKLFGYPAEGAIGRHISLVIPKERMQEEDRIIASLRAGRRIEHFETERLHRDGRLIPVSLTISPIHDARGDVIGASKIVRDITARREAERERDRFAREMAEVDARKNEFLATLSHELRNPLAPIANMLEVLRLSDADPDARREAREVMDRQVRQLVRLVDDLLDLNRITRNRLDLRMSDLELSPIVMQAVEACRPLIDAAGQSLDVELPHDAIYLRADPARLAQVFGNLLTNASRYSPPGSRICLSARRSGGEVVVSVKDNGIGIASERLQDIFEMFVQLEPAKGSAQGGLGIGLTLARRLVNMHGGSIEARSGGEGKGSEFLVRLPAVAAAPVREAPAEPTVETPVPRRVLVVDDNEDAASSIAMLLGLSGNETRLAHDGETAFAAAAEYKPDLVLLDIGLPRMSGHEVCRRIRDQPWGKRLKVIALTGWGQEQDRRQTEEAGFDGHLVKPVDPATLMDVLASV